MFIYSNHYLIISKLTQENFKDYSIDHFFTFSFLIKDALDLSFIFHEPIQSPYTGIDNDSYKLYDYSDYIDLTIYEFESPNFVVLKVDHNNIVDSNTDNDSFDFFAEKHENNIESWNNMKIINDQIHRSLISEPFVPIHLCIPFTYFENITQKDLDIKDKKEREKKIAFRKYVVFRASDINLEFEDDLDKPLYFPQTQRFIYFLNENTYKYIPGSDNYVDEGDDLNHIVNHDYCIDLEPFELEYWHEPMFVFPLIREMHFHREEKDFFDDLHTSPANYDWFNTSEFDNSVDRYA